MIDSLIEPEHAPSSHRSCWSLALAATWFTSSVGFLFALHQFLLKFLYDQSSYTRTPGGALMILLGFAGIGLPFVLIRNRQRFLSLRPLPQRGLATAIPLVHVVVLAACLATSHRSRTIILCRPFTTTAIISYVPGNSRVTFRGGWKSRVGPAAYNDAKILPDGSEEFSSYLAEQFIQDALAGPETVSIKGHANRQGDGSVQITLDVVAREAVRFAVENLEEVTITRDGRPIDEAQSQSGAFRLSVHGRVKEEAAASNAALFAVLQSLARQGRLKSVERLLDQGVDPNTHPGMPKEWSPLMMAAEAGHLDVVELLVDRGADIHFQCGDGFTAVTAAAGEGRWDVVAFLAEHGGDLTHKDARGISAVSAARDALITRATGAVKRSMP